MGLHIRALEIGLHHALHVREERLSTRHDACRLLYVSDIHLRNGRSNRLCRQVLDSVTRSKPDVVLLGGDLVDRASELITLGELVGRLHEVAPVLAIAGNHDRQIGIDRVREAVVRGGGQWIHDGVARVMHGERVIAISGPETDAARAMAMSTSCVLITRESGRHRAMPATTSSWPGTCTAASWSPANIETACSPGRSSTRIAS